MAAIGWWIGRQRKFASWFSPSLSGVSPKEAAVSAEDASVVVRPLQGQDWDAWRSLWDSYNAFYGRDGAKALPEEVTRATWTGLTTVDGPLHGLVAEADGKVIGLAHYLYHTSTIAPAGVCYLQDLIVAESARRQGVGARLVGAVKAAAQLLGVQRVYWHTQDDNVQAINLYQKVGRRTGFIVFSA
jgi:GNAT superfamily N-acetyltransferase